jgi:hypothetical protein
MTTATITQYEDTNLRQLNVNGRFVDFVTRITEITQTNPGFFTGKAGGEDFQVFGGVHAGGTKNDWFWTWPPITGESGRAIHVNSLREALTDIEGA